MTDAKSGEAARTSESDPIRVDLLPCPFEGQVGLTFAPGKHAHSKLGAMWRRDLATDLDRLVAVYGTKVLVPLVEDHELTWLRIPNLVAEAERRGMNVHRLPIPDGGVPPSFEAVERLIDTISDAVLDGRNVVIHCQGGIGRAGTIGGCFLVRHGQTADEALQTLHRCRGPNSPETDGQRQFIRGFAERVSGGPRA